MPDQESGMEQIVHWEIFNNFLDSIHLDGEILKPQTGEAVHNHLDEFTTEELQNIQNKAEKEIKKAVDHGKECIIPTWNLEIADELRVRSEKK